MNVESRVLDLMAQVTEQPVDTLSREMSFEHDLHLDSIKLVQMSTSLPDIFADCGFEDCLSDLAPQNMAGIKTLGDLMDILEHCLKPALGNGSNEKEMIRDMGLVRDQLLFLIARQAISTCSLCSRARLRGPVDIEVLNRTWVHLLDRHPILRAWFEAPGGRACLGDYRLKMNEALQPPPVDVRDLRDLALEAREEVLEEAEIKWKAHEWDPCDWPLHGFQLFRLTENESELFFANTHLISDGISNQIVMREFLEIYGKLSGNASPGSVSYTRRDYDRLVGIINSWEDKNEVAAYDRFVLEQDREAFTWNPLDRPVRSVWPRVKTLAFSMDEETTTRLMANTKAWRISVASFTACAYLGAMAKFDTPGRPVAINIPTSGRIYPGVDGLGANAFEMVGCFAQNLTLGFRLPVPEETAAGLLTRVHQAIHGALAHGYDRAQLAKMKSMGGLPVEDGKLRQDLKELIRSEVKSNVYLSFIGRTNIGKNYGDLEVTDYRAVTTTAANTLDTLVEMIHGRIQFTVNFDTEFFTTDFIEKFGTELMAQAEFLADAAPPRAGAGEARASRPGEPGEGPGERPGNKRIREQVLAIGRDILDLPMKPSFLEKDLEADLGMDSLERIRIITRIRDLYPGMDAQALMACRSLGEMAGAIGPEQAVADPVPAAADSDFARMPYQRIISQCKTRPDEMAILYEGEGMTYGELHRQSNRLARYLRQSGITTGSFVGVLTNRGPRMQIAIQGILKAGGTYVPIDPRYPGGRINYMINHAGMPILLSEKALDPLLTECTKEIKSLKTVVSMSPETAGAAIPHIRCVARSEWTAFPADEVEYVNTPDDLMVVLYTSGSTGNPKGVMLNHRGYTNRLEWHQKAFRLEPGERVAQKTSCSFDISVWELFWPLMEGGVCCPVETDIVMNPWALARWMAETRINIMHFVPSMFGEFVNALETDRTFFPDLRWLIYSGEALPVPYIRKWVDKHGTRTGLSNLYGPTEASIDVTYYMIEGRPPESQTRIPIGAPVDNTHILILDREMNRLPQGQEGELYIAGVQLAKGYLNDKEKTDAAFKPNPFPDIDSEHLYKSGDLAVELPDGNFDYHGRIDGQIKIRGFRVELGEIEAVMNSHDRVKESGVLAVDLTPERKRLIAWVSANMDDPAPLKDYIADKLPHYMIPHTIHFMESLPKTPNGKLDRKALKATLSRDAPPPEPAPAAPAPADPAPPATADPAPTPPAAPDQDAFLPLGPGQKWLTTYFDPPWEWAGSSRVLFHDALDVDVFDRALNALIQAHAALRTVFVERDGTLVQQVIQPDRAFVSDIYDGSHLTPEQRDDEVGEQIRVNSRFDISQWPLFRVVIIKVSDTCYDMLVIGHHIIADMLSNGIIFTDLWAIYADLLAGKAPRASRARGYDDFVRLLMDREAKGELASHPDFWKALFPGGSPVFEIPRDFETGQNLESSSAVEAFTLGRTDTKTLMTEVKSRHQCSLHMLLLAPLYKLLADWTGRPRVIVSHRMNGRDPGGTPHFFNSVGNFAVNFPLPVDVDANISMAGLTGKLKAGFDALPMNGVTYDFISDRLPSPLYPDSKLTPVRANYLGDRTLPAPDLFEFKAEDRDRRLSSPDQKRTAVMEFFFYTESSDLHLAIDYSTDFHTPETVQNLGARYLSFMRDLIRETPEKEKPKETAPGPAKTGRIIPLRTAAPSRFPELAGRIARVFPDTAVAKEIMQALRDNGVNTALPDGAGPDLFIYLSDPESAGMFGFYDQCRSLIPKMKPGSRIIHILDSGDDIDGDAHALLAMTQSLAKETETLEIRVNALWADLADSPAGRVTRIVNLVLFLCSGLSDGMTGECITI